MVPTRISLPSNQAADKRDRKKQKGYKKAIFSWAPWAEVREEVVKGDFTK